MIRELVELAEKMRSASGSSLNHDALKTETVGIDCIIRRSGEFVRFECFDRVSTVTEALSSKKGKARLLVDKCEEVLGIEAKGPSKEGWERKHRLFREKLERFRGVSVLSPVLIFYENPSLGFDRARLMFLEEVPEKKRGENISFRVLGEDRRIHEDASVYGALMREYESAAAAFSANNRTCSICGENKHPVRDQPHGMVKRVPAGQSSGCALVSYNNSAFEMGPGKASEIADDLNSNKMAIRHNNLLNH